MRVIRKCSWVSFCDDAPCIWWCNSVYRILAIAQTAPAPRETERPPAGEILVKARTDNPVAVGKTEERLFESPQSVSGVDLNLINAINTNTIAESLN